MTSLQPREHRLTRELPLQACGSALRPGEFPEMWPGDAWETLDRGQPDPGWHCAGQPSRHG